MLTRLRVKTPMRLLAVAALLLCVVWISGDSAPGGPALIDKPLIAHWDFDDAFGTSCADISGQGRHAAAERPGSLSRVEGVFGNAMSFGGNHLLQVAEMPGLDDLPAISFSAWTLPTELSSYREIFRKEDGDSRLLFSFQNDGTILSLGLNINGYLECDAPVAPDTLLDGTWHHCAATFDGIHMRVYLDGAEIGSRERPGVISAGGLAAGCIGSNRGGELFEGLIDDLRIYRAALTADEVQRLHTSGREALSRQEALSQSDEPTVGEPPIAHWTFNETKADAPIAERSGNAALEIAGASTLPRTRGVHGRALRLTGEHALATAGGLGIGELDAITFAAWAMPTDLSGYREIYRKEDGERRLLFSFQGDGTILSLGLNIGGYIECDAEINPAVLADGQWHHCAATFDGQWMRVFLDGKQIGSLERSGQITTDPNSVGFIGSSGGGGEYFQGALDDLRIYKVALSPEQVASLHRAGADSLAAFDRQLEDGLKAFYAEENTFAQTVAASRQKLMRGEGRLTMDLARVLAGRLQKAFPEEWTGFTEWTGASPVEYLASRDEGFQAGTVDRLVGLLMEYAPITDDQKAKQTPEQAAAWDTRRAIANRYEELRQAGEAAEFSPDWISIILEAGPQITFRPRVSEAVAPYRRPETPETRTLSAEEARARLERDWRHQAGGDAGPERIRQEIQWTRDLAARIAGAHADAPDFAGQLSRLDDLQTKAGALEAVDNDLYFAVREIKREIMFANPVVDFHQVLFVDMPYPQGSEWPHETRHRLGYMTVPGGRLLVLDGLSPAGKLRQLMPQAPLHGAFWRPDLSFDGEKVVFCFRPHNEKSMHLYEINIDGSGLKQLTDGPYDDLDPIYLPDGKHIAFSTTRGHTYVRCMPPTNAYVLARCDSDGRNIYLISANNEPDYLPSVMNDGRILYTRWEYTDKPLWRAQGLWTVYPDGTRISTLWGNQSVWPDLLKDARSIPGSSRVMFTGSAHHNWFSGSVGIINPDRGFNFPDGLTKVTADVEWPESGNGPVDPLESPDYHASGAYSGYYSPYPLSEEDFLVSANRGGKFVLYLMDVQGNRELIYEGANHIFHAIPVRPRTRPPVLPDMVEWPSREERLSPKNGTIFSSDIYEGVPENLRGKAKYLRVLNIEPKTYTYWHKRPYASTGPVVSMVQSEGVKRVLGTVPVEEDGSVAFNAPPGMALHFQLLDEQYRALQTMRSFASVMPGETRGCLGCHELHSKAPPSKASPLAVARGPQEITPPPWGEDTVSYDRYVQPVLDRHCGSCHQGDGKAREVLDLTRRKGYAMFDEPYVTLIGRPSWGAPYQAPENPPPGFGIANTIMVEGYDQRDPAAYQTPEPMTRLSYTSPLIEIASSGKHHGVKVDEVSRRKLIAWVDTMCPYRGDEEVREIPDPEFQGVDWLAIRPRIKTAPRIVRPGPVY